MTNNYVRVQYINTYLIFYIKLKTAIAKRNKLRLSENLSYKLKINKLKFLLIIIIIKRKKIIRKRGKHKENIMKTKEKNRKQTSTYHQYYKMDSPQTTMIISNDQILQIMNVKNVRVM